MAGSVVLRCFNRGFLSLSRPTALSARCYVRGETRATALSARCYVQGEKSPEVELPVPPKRPIPGYISFSSKINPKVRQQHPDYRSPEVARTIGAMWQALSEQEKQSYAPDFKVQMEAYVKQRKAYKDCLTLEQQQALKTSAQKKKDRRMKTEKKKVSKALDKPKRPPNGYILFCNKQRANREGEFKQPTELFRKIAQEWRALAEVDKELYNDGARELFERYNKELQVWEERMLEEEHPELLRGYKKRTKPQQALTSTRSATKKKKTAKTATMKAKKGKSEE